MTSPEPLSHPSDDILRVRTTDLDSDRILIEVPGHDLPSDGVISAVEAEEHHDTDTRGLVMLSLLRFSS